MSVSSELAFLPADLPPEYVAAMQLARQQFLHKLRKYGISWLLLRPTSITDQALIKAFRARKIGFEDGANQVGESVDEDVTAMVNYATMALYIVRHNPDGRWPVLGDDTTEIEGELDRLRQEAAELLIKKNHDYDEAWRKFRFDTFVDLILTKLYRIRSLESIKPYNAEAIIVEWLDILNYACLLRGLRASGVKIT